jgi:RPA family protein
MSRSYGPAVRVRIEDVLKGEFEETTLDAARFLRLPQILGVSSLVSRVRVLGIVTYSMISDDRRYGKIIVEDGTGAISMRVWEEDVDLIIDPDTGDPYEVGTILDVIARVRAYKEEKYLYPTLIVKLDDPNWLIVNNLELMRRRLKQMITFLRSSHEKFKHIEPNEG